MLPRRPALTTAVVDAAAPTSAVARRTSDGPLGRPFRRLSVDSRLANVATDSPPTSGATHRRIAAPAAPPRGSGPVRATAVGGGCCRGDEHDAGPVESAELRVEAPCHVRGERRVDRPSGGAGAGATSTYFSQLCDGIGDVSGEQRGPDHERASRGGDRSMGCGGPVDLGCATADPSRRTGRHRLGQRERHRRHRSHTIGSVPAVAPCHGVTFQTDARPLTRRHRGQTRNMGGGGASAWGIRQAWSMEEGGGIRGE